MHDNMLYNEGDTCMLHNERDTWLQCSLKLSATYRNMFCWKKGVNPTRDKQTKPYHRAIKSRLSNLWMVPKSYVLFHWSCKQPYVKVRHSVSNCEICFSLFPEMTHTILKTFLKFLAMLYLSPFGQFENFLKRIFPEQEFSHAYVQQKRKTNQPTNQ